ncbi:STAS domain-containing protein [Arachidicoccus sp.]|uniref:STAS domain-containing protein n=1 Tax=Arachidicoccus sp. TaxID=1872624 RepID=UPI003D24C033
MKVKVDTKEIFYVARLEDTLFSVNMAEELTSIVTKKFHEPAKNVIIDFQKIVKAENQALIDLAILHQLAYKNETSFVLCNIQPDVLHTFEELHLIEALNITPTESEAWDIVQMEEIERELLSGD